MAEIAPSVRVDEEEAFVRQFTTNQIGSCIFSLIFTMLLSFDVYKAFKRKAYWIPGESLVISALFIQLLSFIDNWNINANSNDPYLRDTEGSLLFEDPLLYQTKRVMICVFISYLLPGVVRSRLETVWGNIGALVVVVIWHMGSEVYFLLKFMKSDWKSDRLGRILFEVSYATLLTALILLVVLFSCAAIAGKSIRKIISQKVQLALSCCCNCPEKQECDNIENHVLKCWILCRASRPDYIMARSVFISFAGFLNTVCFVLLVATWGYTWTALTDEEVITIAAFCMQFVFIIMGSIVMLFRWFTAVIYFPRDVRSLFPMEDFWTRSIVNMKKDLDAHLTSRLFRGKINPERTPLETIVVNLITTFRLHDLLFMMVFLLQKLIVSLSKTCWCLSHLAFRMIRPKDRSVLKTDQFYQYEAALDKIRMPGETASSLWIANLSAFKETENNMKNGLEIGDRKCAELITLMEDKTGTVQDEAPTSLEEGKQFREVGKSSWKMRAVSLIHFMMYFYDWTNYDVIKDSFEAYSQAWRFMDIVDSLDPEGQLVSLTADTEFDTIKKIWGCLNPPIENVSKKLLEEKIKSPLELLMKQCELEERTAAIERPEDSRDWIAVAAKISLYKVWKIVDVKSSSADAIHHLRSLLANLIAHCMEKELDKAMIGHCHKWVEEGRETEIFDAAFIAGVAKAVRKKIKSNPAVRDHHQTEVVAGEGHDISEAEPLEGEGNKVIEKHAQNSGDSQAILEIEAAEGL